MPETSFRWFLLPSLAALRCEVPEAYSAMCRALAPRTLHVDVDGETVTLAFAADAVTEAIPGERPAVALRTTSTAILAVIDARVTLLGAVLADRLELRGAPGDVLAFHEAFLTYVAGAVRAPTFPVLLARYRETHAPRKEALP